MFLINFDKNLHSKPICASDDCSRIICIEIKDDKYFIRRFTKREIERLFMFPQGYTCEKRNFGDLYGNSVIVSVIQGIVGNLVN